MNPFSPDGTYYNSKHSANNIVDHTTSWLTINPYKGCSLKCAYCFRVEWFPGDNPLFQISPEEAVEVLVKHPEFVPHITPLSINISSTDALLPAVRDSTFKSMDLLDKMGMKNPFGITTKLGFRKNDINFLKGLKNIRPIIFVSLAFIPEVVEPVPVEPRIRNLEILSKAKIPTVYYFRPIVKGWNDSEEIIVKALTLANQFADAICIGTLRQSDRINPNIRNSGITFGNPSSSFEEKTIEDELEKKILATYQERQLRIPLFKHTSCAVSYLLTIPNYNHLYTNPSKNCIKTCPHSQQIICRPNLAYE